MTSIGLAFTSTAVAKTAMATDALSDRIHGLLVGSLIGDALGGPIEFQDPIAIQALVRPPKRWHDEEALDAAALREAAGRVWLRDYSALRPQPEPYAHWFANAPAGTITDDSRHKFILLHALRGTLARPERRLGVAQYAQAHLDWPLTALKRNPEHSQLCNEWIEPWRRAARWILGSRNLAEALPPLRMWNGVPTCCGQMSLPPLAAVFAGQPVAAYRAAYQLAFFDNGFGRDMNAVFLAALATALTLPNAPVPDDTDEKGRQSLWEPVLQAVRSTDPYQYRDIPWMQRPVEYWLEFALQAVQKADGHPARFFAAFDQEFAHTTKWEAQVPFAVVFGTLALAQYHPMAAMALSIEWGHDTDSFAQLLGALIGARLGASAFPTDLRALVTQRLKEDAGEDVGEWVQVLTAAAQRARDNTLLAAE
jgi:ADP-ribosylglycohydrolase